MYFSRERTPRGSRLLAGAGLQPAPFVLKFHLVLPVCETSETGCKPVFVKRTIKELMSVCRLSFRHIF